MVEWEEGEVEEVVVDAALSNHAVLPHVAGHVAARTRPSRATAVDSSGAFWGAAGERDYDVGIGTWLISNEKSAVT